MIAVLSYSEIGSGHRDNEDAFAVRPHPDDERRLLVALADGQGGQAGGGRAAQLAVRSALEEAAASPAESLNWAAILRRADRAVSADAEAGYTTLIGLSVCGNVVAGASCGDSMALALGGGRAADLTRGQQKNPPVGSRDASFVPFEAVLVAPWRLLVMSDGVWKYVGRDRLRELASRHSGQALIDALQSAARLPGSGKFQDDFTLIVIQDSE